MELALDPRVRLRGEHDGVSPLFVTEVLRLMVPVNPPCEVTVTIEDPWLPSGKVREGGFAAMTKLVALWGFHAVNG